MNTNQIAHAIARLLEEITNCTLEPKSFEWFERGLDQTYWSSWIIVELNFDDDDLKVPVAIKLITERGNSNVDTKSIREFLQAPLMDLFGGPTGSIRYVFFQNRHKSIVSLLTPGGVPNLIEDFSEATEPTLQFFFSSRERYQIKIGE